jgi:hypothetical protein
MIDPHSAHAHIRLTPIVLPEYVSTSLYPPLCIHLFDQQYITGYVAVKYTSMTGLEGV